MHTILDTSVHTAWADTLSFSDTGFLGPQGAGGRDGSLRFLLCRFLIAPKSTAQTGFLWAQNKVYDPTDYHTQWTAAIALELAIAIEFIDLLEKCLKDSLFNNSLKQFKL